MNTPKEKKCSKCGELKSVEEYYKDKACKDGIKFRCKCCEKEHRKQYYQSASYKKAAKTSRIKNSQNINAYNSRRRSKKKNLLHPLHNKRIEECFHLMTRILREQTGNEYEVDHIIPINKGGIHHHCNLQVIEASKNSSKLDSLIYQDQWVMHFTDLPTSILELFPDEVLNEAYKEIEKIDIKPFECFSSACHEDD